VLKLNGYGRRQAKVNGKRLRFKGWETLVNNYTDDIALPLYLIEEGYRFSIVTQKENGGVRDFYLTKGNRRIHVILISEAERTALIKNYKQSKFPVYFTTGIREFALIYQNIAKTNPKLRKVTDGLYQLTNERID